MCSRAMALGVRDAAACAEQARGVHTRHGRETGAFLTPRGSKHLYGRQLSGACGTLSNQ